MKPKKRQKLCQSCEGEIDLDVIVCPYCAADLREEKPEQQRSIYSASTRTLNGPDPSFDSLYPAPHAPKPPAAEEPPAYSQPQAKAIEDEGTFRPWLPIFLLTAGVQLFLLGLLTLIFSYQGAVVLKWSARFWFVCLFVSFPLLVFGYRFLSKLDS